MIVVSVFVGCSSGVVAIVSSPTNIVDHSLVQLSFPEPLQVLKGYEESIKDLVESTTKTLEQVKESERNEDVPLGSLQPCSCCKTTIRIPKNPYTRHQEAARALPSSFFIKNDSDVRYGLGVNKLVEVCDGRGYRINRLSYSKSMLLPEVKKLLEEMGNDYADALEGTDSQGTVFRVTSLLRTEKQQISLAVNNRSATKGASTHSYGASFDIAFMDRPNEKANCNLPTQEIQNLLLKYQDEGRILIIPEGGCMHVTLVK